MFTQKHFVFVANVLKSVRWRASGAKAADSDFRALDNVVTEFIETFERTHPKFDVDKFARAALLGMRHKDM